MTPSLKYISPLGGGICCVVADRSGYKDTYLKGKPKMYFFWMQSYVIHLTISSYPDKVFAALYLFKVSSANSSASISVSHSASPPKTSSMD